MFRQDVPAKNISYIYIYILQTIRILHFFLHTQRLWFLSGWGKSSNIFRIGSVSNQGNYLSLETGLEKNNQTLPNRLRVEAVFAK